MITALTLVFGAAGAVTRFLVDASVRRRWAARFPWATFSINATGSFLLGILAGVVLFHHQPAAWQTVVGSGFCGGYTTFSTASFETVRLAEQKLRFMALVNALGALVTSVAVCGAGLALAWML
jgi:CrcB protein